MYKLVVVAGELRGKEFVLDAGANTIGRGGSSNIEINLAGVSTEHFSITVHDDSVFLKDLGSANGTLVNDKQVKTATLVSGDKIIIPNLIMQLVYVKEKKIFVKVSANDEATIDSAPMPPDLVGKIKHYFKYRLMTLVYGINKEMEWHSLLSVSIGVFIVIAVGLIIMPILDENKNVLTQEVVSRGVHYVRDISRENKDFLEERKLDQVNVRFLDDEEGVVSYELFDRKGRIVRPISQLNTYTSDPFSISAHSWALGKGQDGTTKISRLSDGSIGVAQAIRSYSSKKGSLEVVGIVALKLMPKSMLMGDNNSAQAYLESLVTGIVLSIILFAVIYYLTLRPIEELSFQLDEVQRGKRRLLETDYIMKEFSSVKNNINNIIQRWREAQTLVTGVTDEVEDDGAYVMRLEQFLRGSGDPVLLLNSVKLIKRLNSSAEELLGMRESASEGQNLMDAAREKGFAATVNELCDMSANNEGICQTGQYELGGTEYNINVVSLVGKDGFAKAFYITFVR